ncbi:MAG: gamma-glutamyltransferase [Pseudomonadota bacterium]
MVTADHPLAVQAGAAVLESGGLAADAAAAANLVLAVVRPHMCGLGGDLFALVYDAARGRVEALNASGRAPAGAAPEFFRDHGFTSPPESGILSATVPGALSGWAALLARFGTRTLAELLPPAIRHAAHGFPVYPELRRAALERRDVLAGSDDAVRTFFPNGQPPKVGARLVQRDLAQTLETIARDGPEAFYRGPLGAKLVDCSDDRGGLFAARDLAEHRVEWTTPLSSWYRGLELVTLPPNSQGVALLQQANILENFELSKMKFEGADLIELMVKAKTAAFADRDRLVCDPAFHPVPLDFMLGKDHARDLAGGLDAAVKSAPPEFTRGGHDTVYLSAVDARGNVVAVIQSLYEYFGSGVMVPGTGMLLHNRGRGFSLEPGHPNRIAPGKRPYHTLHCALGLRDGRPVLALGTPGADGQTQTVMQLLAQVVDFGLNPQEAVERPRWRSNPDGTLWIEDRFDQGVIAALEKRGLKPETRPGWDPAMGSAQVVSLDHENRVISAGADPRRQAYALGA